ncbi:MAG: hypothetical protein CME70_02320 [Halobacteriovorax sp.]|nr:hypothetical protein [Halobacteriovorax sp.]|tara:strand:- start:54390 stop:55427 length:1038 start_codon:yes stop_codon:yes gene_type:complete
MELQDLKVCILSSYGSAPSNLTNKLESLGVRDTEVFINYSELVKFLSTYEGTCLLFDLLGNENLRFNIDLDYFVSQATPFRLAQALRWDSNNEIRPIVEIDSDFRIISEEVSPENEVIDGLIRLPLYFFDSKEFLRHISSEGIDFKDENWIGLPLAFPRKELSYSNKTPALFLDRDGVINIDKGYVYKYEEIIYIEEIFPIIKMFNDKKWPVFVLTNQSGIGQGKYQEADVHKLHTKMIEDFTKKDIKIEEWQYSPYHFDKGIREYKRLSFTRKPGSGMALKILEDYPIDIERSFMIGDKKTDQILLPGITTLLIKGNYDIEGSNSLVFNSIGEIHNYLEEQIKN